MEVWKKIIFISYILIFAKSEFFYVEELIPRYLSFLVKENNKKELQTQKHDVVLIQMELNYRTNCYENILEELLKENPENPIFTHSNLNSFEIEGIHTSSFFIIVTDVTNSTILFELFKKIFNVPKNLIRNYSKFVLVHTRLQSLNLLTMIFIIFDHFGITNGVVIRQNDKLTVFKGMMFLKTLEQIKTQDLYNFDLVFPDKLKNLHNCQVNLFFIQEETTCVILNGEVDGVHYRFLRMILKKYNATMNITKSIDISDGRIITKELQEFFKLYSVSLSLSTLFTPQEYTKEVNTYDEDGFCALIPKPQRVTFLHFILSPFDLFSWVGMISSIVLCSILWKFLKKRLAKINSSFYFAFAMVANFLGQSIPLRSSRWNQKLLLQVCILMTFIMGNSYQSLIISTMLTSREGLRIKTWEEMFNSSLTYKVDSIFKRTLAESGEFATVINRMSPFDKYSDYQNYANEEIAIIATCNQIEKNYYKTEVSNSFYLLPGRFNPFYVRFPLGPWNPLYELLQRNFDYLFESGIRQPMHRFFQDRDKKYIESEIRFIENEEYLLKMNDVYGIFYILLVAHLISILTFLCELLWSFKQRRKSRRVKNQAESENQ
ncbi:CLUMA_CG006216, isoform A [Clunio marinus]|uniref:CLUMA_CG006216, isoform A n=1 Tax=Clunio marinus TaxID=568069 RepID=A0A1J1HZ91_9DIPT|nr:CLUMA_CG006216, isoform A [Clunio marinus]